MKPALALAFTGLSALVPVIAAHGSDPPCELTIAFIGDQGLGSDARAVLKLIAAEGASAVIHSGDFDYKDDPARWDAQIDEVLGANFPYFAVIGNHDVHKFYGPGGYQERIKARMERLGIKWDGDPGVRCSFEYQGIFVVMTAPGIFVPMDPMHADTDYLEGKLAADRSIWRISSWHKDMRSMQVGGKHDETGWGVYEAARRGGAIIATGHEHSYSRTHLLSNCQRQEVSSNDRTLNLARDDPATPADEGRSFVFVSGLGGKSIRDQERCMPVTPPYGCGDVWASIYTSDQGAAYGALFATFNYGGDPRLARFYFKDITGRVADEFFVRAAEPPVACRSDINGSGRVDIVDLLMMIQDIGRCA